MINVSIPGYGEFELKYLVLDYNGTLAFDGTPISGVEDILQSLASKIDIHVVTADTYGSVQRKMEGWPCKNVVVESTNQNKVKANYIKKLGSKHTVAIGNGRNDQLMLREAAIGIAVIQDEGAAGDTLQTADIISTDICSALRLLLNPLRIIATLRS